VLVALILLVERERRDQERKRKWRGKEGGEGKRIKEKG
jgi:hypothetical protein